MIYGDNPQKINERGDALGLKAYSYVPQLSAVMQSGNLYVYGINNPVGYVDPTGLWTIALGIEASAVLGIKLGLNVQIVLDGYGNLGVITTGIIGAGTPNATVSGLIMITNADTIYDLSGVSFSTGGSLLVGGLEIICI